MHRDRQWRGVFVIVPTPFNNDLSLDLEGLRRIVRFCIDCGADGLVTPANASEAPYLTDRERQQVVSTVIDEANRKLPVIVGVTSSCAIIACELARDAQEMGADAIIAMPPQVQRASEPEIKAYYAAISGACDLPLFLQNYSGPGGTPMSARLMEELVRTLPTVQYVKEETESSGTVMSAVIETAGPKLLGVMGGKAGRHLLDEYRRGACGTMPACEVTDVHAALWHALEAGAAEKASNLYRRLLPLLTFEVAYGPAVYKEVLRRRGVIRSAAFRQTGGRALDGPAMAELTQILDDLESLLDARYPAKAGEFVT
jgi:4-hydroxy-tetrahydrodipicolinate synthase